MLQGDKRGRATRAVRCKGAHGPPESLLPWGRWYEASPLRTRRVTARRLARGPARGRRESLPLAAACQRPGWRRWRLEETSSTVQGPGEARACAVAQPGQPLAGRLTAPGAQEAAQRFEPLARWRPGLPAPQGRQRRPGRRERERQRGRRPRPQRPAGAILPPPGGAGAARRQAGPPAHMGGTACAAAQAPARGARSGTCARSNRGGASRETTAALGYALAASAPHRQGHRALDDLLRKMCDTTPTRAPGLGLPLGRWVAPLQELLSELLLAVSEEQSLVKL